MKQLEYYILNRVAQMFFVALLPVLAILWTTQVLVRINLVTDSGQSIGSFLLLATLILPTIIPMVLPFALVIGITQTLSAMNNDSELTVIDASGASRIVLVRPIMALAIALSVVSFGVDNVVEPKVRIAARELIAAAYADLLSTVIEEKTFRRIDDGLYVQISKRLQGRTLQGLFVADSRDPKFELLYYAREGAVDKTGTSLIMKDGEVHRKTVDGKVSIIRFDSYSFDLTDLAQSRGQAKLRAIDRDLPFLLNPDLADKDVQKNPGEYRAELHRRLTEWSFPLVYALISILLAGDARSHREARLHPMVAAMAAAFALRWASFYVSNKIEENASPLMTAMLYLIPLATAAICIWLMLRSKRLRLPSSFHDRIHDFVQTLKKRSVAVLEPGGSDRPGDRP